MTLIILLILVLLAGVFLQDVMSHTIYWFLPPVLAILFGMVHILTGQPLMDWVWNLLQSLAFLCSQFLLVSIYFSVKTRRFVNITAGMIGWGDILFLISLAFYFSLNYFILFYVMSLVIVLLFALLSGYSLSGKKIPLAGLQALIFTLFLGVNALFFHIDLMRSNSMLHHLAK